MTSTNQEVVEYIEALKKEYEKEKDMVAKLSKNQATTMFNAEQNDNLIKWQLDIKEELERIEHLLRGHIPRRDDEGNEYWDENTDPDEMLFNERGVREILKIMAWYMNKNFILSNFGLEDIKVRCEQFGNTLIDFIYNNYHEFGWDDIDREKIKHYEMLVMNLVNTVEAVYYRALGGKERDSLRTARQVLQNEPLGNTINPLNQTKKFSVLKPSTWLK